MTKNEAHAAAQSAPQPVQDVLHELIDRAYDDAKPAKKSTKARASKKKASK